MSGVVLVIVLVALAIIAPLWLLAVVGWVRGWSCWNCDHRNWPREATCWMCGRAKP